MLTPGRAEVHVPFRKEITNHLASVHAIALCDAAESAGGMMTEVFIPADARWIPKGLSVEYLAKTKCAVHAITDGSEIDWASAGDKVVSVDISDESRVKIKIRIRLPQALVSKSFVRFKLERLKGAVALFSNRATAVRKGEAVSLCVHHLPPVSAR